MLHLKMGGPINVLFYIFILLVLIDWQAPSCRYEYIHYPVSTYLKYFYRKQVLKIYFSLPTELMTLLPTGNCCECNFQNVLFWITFQEKNIAGIQALGERNKNFLWLIARIVWMLHQKNWKENVVQVTSSKWILTMKELSVYNYKIYD